MTPSNNTSPESRIPYVSASQIITFKRCQRKWYLDKIAKIPVVRGGAGAALGTKHHGEIEKYLLTGVDVRTGAALAGREVLDSYREWFPGETDAMEIELALENPDLRTQNGILFNGRIDVLIRGTHRGGVPLIIDHKFKANLALYGSTETALKDDVQAIVYSRWALEREPDSKCVDFAHHQYQTKKEKIAEEVKVRLTRDDILRSFGTIERLVDVDMLTCSHIESASETHYNLDACNDYGGCEFKKVCPTWKKESKMSLLEELANVKAQSVLPPETPKAPVTEVDKKPLNVSTGGTLFYNTEPYPQRPLINLLDITMRCAQEIANEYGALDIRLVDELGFGKYKAVLAQRVLKQIDFAKDYYMPAMSGLCTDILDVVAAAFPQRMIGGR